MNILIIGSNGFIGKQLVETINKTNNCICVDVSENIYNYSTFYKVSTINTNFDFLFKDISIDVCINASGSANVSKSMIDPITDCNLNFLNVEKILNSIRVFSPNTRFINLSSAAVYGNPKKLPIKETDVCDPLSPYGYHKMISEKICEMFTNLYGIKTYSLRLFSIYGIGQKKMLMWDLVNKFLNDDQVVLYGTGDESRDFINIKDLVRALNLFIDNDKICSGCYNIANGIQLSVAQIAEYVKKSLNSNKKIVFNQQSRDGDPNNWEADITLIKEIGYLQKVNIESGIKDYTEWAINEINISKN